MTRTGRAPGGRALDGRALRRALRCAAGLVLVLGLAAAPVAAQPPEPLRDTPPRLTLDVVRLEGILDPGGELRVRVRVRNGGLLDRGDLRIVATVHQEAIGRWRLQQATGEGVVGSIVHPFVTDVGPVPARGSRTLELTQTTEELRLDRPGQEGVYPLRLQLLADGEVTDELHTSLVVVPEQAEAPLSVGLLLPLALPPARDAEGVVTDGALLDALGHEGSLGSTLAALAAAPDDLAVTLAVDGHTLRDLADLAGGFALRQGGEIVVRPAETPLAARAGTLREELEDVTARARVETLPLPYASADLVALVRHDLDAEAGRHLTDGAAAVAELPGAEVPADGAAATLWPPDAIDAAALAVARDVGVDTVVLAERALRITGTDDRSPSPVRQLRAEGGDVTALVPDPYLEDLLAEGSLEGPAIAAQQVLAEVAAVYFERPGTPRRGLLLAPPAGSSIPAGLLDALAEPLAAAPFARTVPVSALPRRVSTAPRSVGLDYPTAARRRELPLTYATMLTGSRRALGSLDGVLAERDDLTARFDRLLLQSASIHYRDDLPAGRSLLRAVSSTVAEVYDAVEVLDSPPVTLTAVEGALPVTVRSSADVPLRVRISLRSARFEVEGGPTREVVLEPGTTDILTFRVRALAPGGTSPVQVVVSDLDGVLDLATGTVVVRSTAFSVAAVITTVGAALFLLLWWARGRAARRRDPGRPAPRVPDRETAPAPSTEVTS